MKTKFLILLFIFICFTIIPAKTQVKLNLNRCINLAIQNNPLIKSYNHQHKAFIARTVQARAIPQPEISLDYDLQPKPFQFAKSDEQYIGISQLIEMPGRRLLRGKIAKKEALEFLCDFQQTKLEIIFQVKKTFYELLLELEKVDYAKENLKHANDFLSKAQEKYQSGDVSKLEVLRARVEYARARNNEKISHNMVKLAKARMNFILARDKYQNLEIEGNLKQIHQHQDLDQLIKKALLYRPEVKKNEIAIKREKLNKTQASLSYLPDFSLALSRHKVTDEMSTWDVALSFEVPLFFWQKQKGEIAEAQANIKSNEYDLKYQNLSISLEVENAFHNAVSLKNQKDFFETEVLEEALLVYQMSKISYSEGKISSLELTEARKTLIEIKQSYGEALLNYQLAIAELEKNVAAPITKEGEQK